MKTALIALLLTGCASLPEGVVMSEDERKACAESGCSVWTMAEIQRLIGIALKRGFDAGRKSL
jgi:hypothetical protein